MAIKSNIVATHMCKRKYRSSRGGRESLGDLEQMMKWCHRVSNTGEDIMHIGPGSGCTDSPERAQLLSGAWGGGPRQKVRWIQEGLDRLGMLMKSLWIEKKNVVETRGWRGDGREKERWEVGGGKETRSEEGGKKEKKAWGRV